MTAEDDIFLTVKGTSVGIYRDRGSRFLAFAHHVSSVDETQGIIEKYRKRVSLLCLCNRSGQENMAP